MGKAKVSVGFLHPGHYAACFAESLKELLFYDATVHQRIVSHGHGQLGKMCGAGGIVDGRNKLAQVVLDESDVEWLFMVDSDMSFEPDTVERLIESAHARDRPVVGGLAFAHKTDGRASMYGVRYRPQPTLYDWYEDDERAGFVPRFDYARDQLVEVAATGAACVLIHRLALEAIRERYGDVWFDTIRHPKGAHFSEDLSFCVRVAACDMPLYVDTAVKTGHDKGGVFYDEAFYDAFRGAA
jgi:GT2 family glycosyltransferase